MLQHNELSHSSPELPPFDMFSVYKAYRDVLMSQMGYGIPQELMVESLGIIQGRFASFSMEIGSFITQYPGIYYEEISHIAHTPEFTTLRGLLQSSASDPSIIERLQLEKKACDDANHTVFTQAIRPYLEQAIERCYSSFIQGLENRLGMVDMGRYPDPKLAGHNMSSPESRLILSESKVMAINFAKQMRWFIGDSRVIGDAIKNIEGVQLLEKCLKLFTDDNENTFKRGCLVAQEQRLKVTMNAPEAAQHFRRDMERLITSKRFDQILRIEWMKQHASILCRESEIVREWANSPLTEEELVVISEQSVDGPNQKSRLPLRQPSFLPILEIQNELTISGDPFALFGPASHSSSSLSSSSSYLPRSRLPSFDSTIPVGSSSASFLSQTFTIPNRSEVLEGLTLNTPVADPSSILTIMDMDNPPSSLEQEMQEGLQPFFVKK